MVPSASVAQRTRESGIRLAVGATRFAVELQFLGEAVMLGLTRNGAAPTRGAKLRWGPARRRDIHGFTFPPRSPWCALRSRRRGDAHLLSEGIGASSRNRVVAALVTKSLRAPAKVTMRAAALPLLFLG